MLRTVLGLVTLSQATDERWAAFSHHVWKHGGPALPDTNVSVIMALKQRNLGLVEAKAREVSDPDSSEYGRHMSHSEIKALIKPDSAHITAVRELLESEPEAQWRFSKAEDFALVTCSNACIQRLFNTTLLRQEGPLTLPASRLRAATPVQLPKAVEDALDGVSLNAPIFVPRRPEEPMREPFNFSLAGRIAPQMNPQMKAGDAVVAFSFVAHCKDGRANTDRLEDGLCSSSEFGVTITSFEALVVQEPSMQKVVQLPAVSQIFGQRDALCESTRCIQFNISIESIQNYLPTRVMLRSWFSDGSVSPYSRLEEVPRVFPLPYTTPHFLSTFYNMPKNLPVRHPRNAIAVAEFLAQYYNPEDLRNFFRVMGVRAWPGTGEPKTLGPDLPLAGSVLGGEAQLDVQYIMAMVANISTWFWSVPGKELETTQEPFLHWLMQLADHDEETVPLVHSLSYSDDEDQIPGWFKTRANNEFMILGLRGISVLVSSGDDGASGTFVRGDKKYCNRARPVFPTSSPWVTAIGGTQLSTRASPVCGYVSDALVVNCREAAEVTCSSDTGGVITVGGGFSNHFARPWYQEEAVEEYLGQSDSPLPDAKRWHWNQTGRAYPDISGIANNYLIWMKDGLQATSGTSASTPLISAMVAHWNEERLQNGLPPLGFLNPFLYKSFKWHPESFNDIVMGDNRCGVQGSPCCDFGFGAARGWDATTGIGSPRFDAILGLLKAPSATCGSSTTLVEASSAAWSLGQAWAALPMSLPTALLLGMMIAAVMRWRPWLARRPSLQLQLLGS